MAFPPAFLDELRQRIGLASLIGRRVRLAKRGREHIGLCPFHNEKSPSFTVNEDKGFFHCFGCGAHGDAIGFVMRSEGLSFLEAVERLAQEAGLAIPNLAPEDRLRAERASGLASVMEAATAWFMGQLRTSGGRPAYDYVCGRGLSEETLERFRLGYAPNGRNGLRLALTGLGFGIDALVEAGLLIKPDDGGEAYDRFRDRVMFPISDRRARVIAFGGRALSADAQAKYLNSPETPLFHKGRTLYNLALAREAARSAGTVVVVEGYMDVIALAQAGFDHVVAPLGTALTEDQMAELWRLAAEPILCFDGDPAGLRAAYRAIDRALPLLQPGKSFRFALLPPGLDPDDLVKSQGPQGMRAALEAARPFADMLWRKESEGRTLDTPERRAAFEAALFAQVGEIRDANLRSHYQQAMRERLRAQFASAAPARFSTSRGKGNARGNRPAWGRAADPGDPPPPSAGGGRRERLILLGALVHPWLVERHEEAFADFPLAIQELDKLRQEILSLHRTQPGLDQDGLRHYLIEQGFSELLAALTGENRPRLERFTKPDCPETEVEAGWLHVLHRHRRTHILDQDLRDAEARLAQDPTEMNYQRFMALKRQLDEERDQDREAGH